MERTLDIVEELLDLGSDYIALGDPQMANPRQVGYSVQNRQKYSIA